MPSVLQEYINERFSCLKTNEQRDLEDNYYFRIHRSMDYWSSHIGIAANLLYYTMSFFTTKTKRSTVLVMEKDAFNYCRLQSILIEKAESS